ncbi:hypothetical protein MPRF_47400 [Mycolicibacterium parafortuitum]|uniref:Uncharacterized protein n=1 Tax=Mycolicibacterium parafortuitum TaxID=39692 RepID=A0A7I7UA20_MYCPF|nr:hypothetical protein MPRF_47400 [Mycolicibacterium parafortuitum]
MDVAKVLKDAWQAVEDSGVPKEMQEIAFNRAVDLYGYAPSVAQPPITAPSPDVASNGSGNTTGSGASTGTIKSESAFYESMCKATGISEDALLRLIDIHEGAPRIALKASQLPNAAAKAQKVVSLLIILARHYYNDENEVALSYCLAECKRLSCLNDNFKRDVGRIDDLLLTGTGTDTKAKVREPLVKSAKESLKKLGVSVE